MPAVDHSRTCFLLPLGGLLLLQEALDEGVIVRPRRALARCHPAPAVPARGWWGGKPGPATPPAGEAAVLWGAARLLEGEDGGAWAAAERQAPVWPGRRAAGEEPWACVQM